MSKALQRFRFALVPTLTVLILLPVLISLGVWQLHRAEYKRDLQAEYDARAVEAPVRIRPRPQSARDLRFHRATVTGVYDARHQILLDNRVHDGRPGYYVITPLRVGASDMHVLVNRGWVPMGDSRDILPNAPVPVERVTVTGLATVPLERGFHLGPAVVEAQGWNPLWQYLDLDLYRQLAPFPVQPVVLLLDPDSEAGGYVRDWQRLDAGIAVHQGYAFQWFALAAALLAIYIMLNRRSTNTNMQDSSDDDHG